MEGALAFLLALNEYWEFRALLVPSCQNQNAGRYLKTNEDGTSSGFSIVAYPVLTCARYRYASGYFTRKTFSLLQLYPDEIVAFSTPGLGLHYMSEDMDITPTPRYGGRIMKENGKCKVGEYY